MSVILQLELKCS